MPEEKPTIDELEIKEETKTEQVDVENLMKELEAANITNPDQLKGRLINAQNYDRVQSERDIFKNELAQIRSEFADFKNQSSSKTNDYFEGGYQDQQPIDLEVAITNVYRKERQREQQENVKYQQHMAKLWSDITSDPDYHLVRESFEAAIRDPITVMKIQSGEIDPNKMFNNLLRDHYKTLTKRTIEALKQMRESGQVLPPHIESGAQTPESLKQETDKEKKIKELRKKAGSSTGLHDDEMDLLIDSELGDIFKERL